MIQYNNHVECLDLHLSEITLNSYRGTLPEIIFDGFFVVRARVLKVMMFALHLFHKNEWFVNQRRRLRQICPSFSRRVAKLAGREACAVNFTLAREQAHQ